MHLAFRREGGRLRRWEIVATGFPASWAQREEGSWTFLPGLAIENAEKDPRTQNRAFETAFTMDTLSIKDGPGVTRAVGNGMKEPGTAASWSPPIRTERR